MTKRTLVNFLLDRTGSMGVIKKQTISGFNEYLNALKKEAKDNKTKISMSLTQFDSVAVDVEYVDKDIKKVDELNEDTYQPRAMTPMYDAIGITIRETEKRMKKKRSKPKVLFVIMTDGEENASKEYDQNSIKKLLKEKEKGDWTFIYLGANQDAWANARKFGMSKGNTMSFDSKDAGDTLCSLGASVVAFTSGSNTKTRNFFKDHGDND